MKNLLLNYTNLLWSLPESADIQLHRRSYCKSIHLAGECISTVSSVVSPVCILNLGWFFKYVMSKSFPISAESMWLLMSVTLCVFWPPASRREYYLPVWDLTCFAKWEASKYLFPQILQGYGFSPVWALLMWIVKWPLTLNTFPHVSQEYGFSPVWSLIWTFNDDSWLNLFPQVLQQYGFSPVWILAWFFSSDFWLNLFPQIWQRYGLSPVWVLMWTLNSLPNGKSFPHVLQEYGLSPVCVLVWTNKPLLSLKPFPHILQEYGFSPVWSLTWAFNDDEWLNLFPQYSQKYGFSPVWLLKCTLHLDLYWKVFPQASHLKDFLPVLVLLWTSVLSALSLLLLSQSLVWCLSFGSGSVSLADPESPCSPLFWSSLSAMWEFRESWWSLSDSGSLWSPSS